MSSEKTEKPTEHKIRKAREEGQVAKSKDFTQALLVGALFGYMLFDAEGIVQSFIEIMQFPAQLYGLDFLDAVRIEINQLVRAAILILLPFLLLGIVIAVFGEMIQTGVLLAFKALIPKGDRLNPVTNLKQMFSMKNVVEFIKAILKVTFLSVLIWIVLRDSLQSLLLLPAHGLAAFGVTFAGMLKSLVIYSFLAFFCIALADLIFQRYNHIKQLMMSMDEVKQEYKQLEGDPHMKSHRKGLAKEIAMGEMVMKTRKSSAVVTNPTHLAVAIYYDEKITPLPVVVAKGKNEIAHQMVKMARSCGIPVMQNIELARALTEAAKIDQYIPPELVEPIAEFLIALRRYFGASFNGDLYA
jgi:type III secretion protein U